MAFSGLSMAHKNSIPGVDALQHYQQALPLLQASIQSEEDLASDGVFLTHFILLLYEIAAGEPRGLSLWGQHISQLQRIILLRRDLHGTEPYTFIVWWVASIDAHVVLSGMGQGDFIEAMLRHRLLPTGIGSDSEQAPTRNLPPSGDWGALPSSLAFHRRICVLAAEIALLTRDLRDEARRMLPHLPSSNTMNRWQQQIGVLQDTLRRTWNVQMPASVARYVFYRLSEVLRFPSAPFNILWGDQCRLYPTIFPYVIDRFSPQPFLHSTSLIFNLTYGRVFP